MTENESTEQSAGAPAGAAPKKDLVAEFKGQPAAEKLLAIAALAVLIGWIAASGWKSLFKYQWFPTCAFFGGVGVIVLIVLDLFAIKIMDAKVRTYVIIFLAILPAIGYVVDLLHNFWLALMLAGAIAMGLAAAKITTREQIIRK